MTAAAALLVACLLSSGARAQPAFLIVDAGVTPLPEKPRHDRRDPCTGTTFKDDYFGHKKAGCVGQTLMRSAPQLKPMIWKDVDEAGGMSKMWVEELRLQFALELSISITTLYPEGSCPYRFALKHELGHWNDAVDAHNEAVEGFKADIIKAKLPTRENPASMPTAGKLAYAKKEAAVVWAIFQKREGAFRKRLRAATAKRDSPYAYQKNEITKCPGQWTIPGR